MELDLFDDRRKRGFVFSRALTVGVHVGTDIGTMFRPLDCESVLDGRMIDRQFMASSALAPKVHREVTVPNRVIHFEIHAENPQRAIAFYEALFDWKFQQWGDQPYWLVTTGSDGEPGINGGLLPRRGDAPVEGQAVNAFVCTVDVASVDDSLEAALQQGGTLALAKMPIPTVGWLAYVADTEGNLFGMMQADSTAK